MKRALGVMRKDMRLVGRDRLMMYAVLFPLVGALVLRLLIPGWAASPVSIVVTRDMSEATINELRGYARVSVVDGIEALEKRVLMPDDTIGVLGTEQGVPSLVVEGNESPVATRLASHVALSLSGRSEIVVASRDIQGGGLPLRESVAAFNAMMAVIIGSTIMGMGIIEEKEERTMMALAASPLTNAEFIGARSLVNLAIGVPLALAATWLLGVTRFDHTQFLATALVGTLASMLLGFYVGAASSNKLAGIGNMKVSNFLFVIPPVLGLLIPKVWHPALWWSPGYWVFEAFRRVLAEGLPWNELIRLLLANTVVMLVLLLVLMPFLRPRLQLKA